VGKPDERDFVIPGPKAEPGTHFDFSERKNPMESGAPLARRPE
jgi:hypothetical protein